MTVAVGREDNGEGLKGECSEVGMAEEVEEAVAAATWEMRAANSAAWICKLVLRILACILGIIQSYILDEEEE